MIRVDWRMRRALRKLAGHPYYCGCTVRVVPGDSPPRLVGRLGPSFREPTARVPAYHHRVEVGVMWLATHPVDGRSLADRLGLIEGTPHEIVADYWEEAS